MFKPGEIAIFIYDGTCRNGDTISMIKGKHGQEVVIEVVKPNGDIPDEDYGVRFQDGVAVCCPERCLRKRRPPEQYKDQFTPAGKSLDAIIRDANKRSTRISG